MTTRIYPETAPVPTLQNDWIEPCDSLSIQKAGGSHDSGLPTVGSSASREQRSYSMGVSPTGQRPKSAMQNYGSLQALSQHMDECAIDETSEMSHGMARGSGRSQSHGHGSSGSIKGIFRRASVSLKGMVQRRPSIATEHTIYEERTATARPTTSHSTWHRLRQAASFRHSKSVHDFDLTHEPFQIPHQTTEAFHLPVPGLGDEPPVIPRNSGAAAKASAAIQNEYLARNGMSNRWLHASFGDEGNDRESGIGISVTLSGASEGAMDEEVGQAQETNISRVDFIAALPFELAIHVLANLDAAALAKASAVSRDWQRVAANQHIWRESCLRETASTYATSASVQPNTGNGLPPVMPGNDWRQVYRARTELEEKWKTGKARPVYLNGHLDSIYCLQFDENKIITGSRDKTIRVWDMHTLDCRLVIGPPEVVGRPSLFVDEDGDSMHYAAGSDNKRTTTSMPKPLAFDEHHKASILCLQYDEKILVTGSSDFTCIMYDIQKAYRPIRRLRHHTAAVLDLAFDDKHIVTCSKDISICIWDRETGALFRQLHGHTGPVNAVQLRGNTIVSCSGDFLVKLWNIDTGKNIREFEGHTKGLACSQFSEDGRYVASAGNDKVIRIWDANTGECVREMRAHGNLVRSLHIDSISGRLVSGSYDTDIKVWDMETGHQLLDFPRWHASWVLSAKSDYRRIVSTGQDPKILIMDFGADIEGIEMLESRAAPSIGLEVPDSAGFLIGAE